MAAPGWYPDPAGSRDLRYFDGAGWTQHLRPRPDRAPARAPTPPAHPTPPPADSPGPRTKDMPGSISHRRSEQTSIVSSSWGPVLRRLVTASPRRTLVLAACVMIVLVGMLAARGCTTNATRDRAIAELTRSYAATGQAISTDVASCIVDRAARAQIAYADITSPDKTNQDDVTLNAIKQECFTRTR